MEHEPTGAGKSSFELVDAEKLFGALNLQPGSAFLDLACGRGQYTLEAAKYVGREGIIYAVDLWRDGIAALSTEAQARGLTQIRAEVADISRHIPLADGEADICLMATVLHDLVRDGTHDAALQEAERVLQPGGGLAVVEFKKIAGPPGPPAAVRLSAPEVETLLRPHDLRKTGTLDIGPYHYLSMFVLGRRTGPW